MSKPRTRREQEGPSQEARVTGERLCFRHKAVQDAGCSPTREVLSVIWDYASAATVPTAYVVANELLFDEHKPRCDYCVVIPMCNINSNAVIWDDTDLQVEIRRKVNALHGCLMLADGCVALTSQAVLHALSIRGNCLQVVWTFEDSHMVRTYHIPVELSNDLRFVQSIAQSHAERDGVRPLYSHQRPSDDVTEFLDYVAIDAN
jgi:hypothetical protein